MDALGAHVNHIRKQRLESLSVAQGRSQQGGPSLPQLPPTPPLTDREERCSLTC